jgi:hypothetical protein
VTSDVPIYEAITQFLTAKGFLGPDEFLLLDCIRHWRIISDGLVIRATKALPVMSRPGDLMRMSDGSIGFVLLFSLSLSFSFFSLISVSKVSLIFEVFKPGTELFSKELRTVLILQHFLPAPVCRALLLFLSSCCFCERSSLILQHDEEKWPHLQQEQFNLVQEHSPFLQPWIPDVRPLSKCIFEVTDVKEHLYSAPLWIQDWEALASMSEAERIILSFNEQQLHCLQFPWMHLERVEQDEDLRHKTFVI